MKQILLAGLGCLGLVVLALQTSSRALAQDQPKDALMQAAPRGGIAMLQDTGKVYIYDGSQHKIFVVSKSLSEKDGKPVTWVIDVDRIKD
ncbi:MAG: hypothetical protein ACHQ50_03005 [Fimbriimonadales bacterium]